MKTKFSLPLFLAASAVSFGLAASVHAAPPRGDTPDAPPPEMIQKHQDREAKAMARLHDELKLNAKQEALWQHAQKSIEENRQAMRDRFKKHNEEIRAMLSQPGADMRAVTKRMDEFKAEGQKLREDHRDRLLAVYDVLNADQKETVRLFFQKRMERMEKHFDRRPTDRG